jgi:2-oxoglutarate dehydrogenase E2 component (dihydrolipoamide succinyltransferase)
MLSRRVLIASRFLRAHRAPQLRYTFPLVQQFRSYADRIVKVPEMAESISEGTLKQWSKQIGDYVEQDEEIATIETDKASQLPWFRDITSQLMTVPAADRRCCQCP